MHICGLDDEGVDLRERRREREKAAKVKRLAAGRFTSRKKLQCYIPSDFAVVVVPVAHDNVQLLTELTSDCNDIDRRAAGFRLAGKAVEIIRGTNFGRCKRSACPHGQDCSVAMA